MVKVSILIPAYNGERFIKAAIDSVLNQTMQDFEVIAVDDVSTDKTWRILYDYAEKYPDKFIAIKHDVNKGQAGSLNTALAKAKGKYICTLDVDDLYEKDKLDLQCKYLDEHRETAVVYTDGYYLNEDGSQKTDYNSYEYDPHMLHRFNFIPNGSTMSRRLNILDVGGFDESLRTCQDYDLWLRMLDAGCVIEKMPFRSYSYRQHGGQKSRKKLLNETLKLIHDKWKHIVVSVVVPVYNGEQYLKGCLESILKQKCHDYDINQRFEVIIVDDGSTDKTADICMEYVKRDDRFKYVKNEENKGIGYTRNKGIDEAVGDFLCFISADDEMLPDYVLTMIKANQNYPDAVLYSDYALMDDFGNVSGVTKMPSYTDSINLATSVVAQADFNKMFVNYNCFASTKFWKENKFDPELRYGEDLEHLLRCVLFKKQIFMCVQIPLFKYRIGANTTTTKKLMAIPENNKMIKRSINKQAGRVIFEVGQ